MFEWLVPVLAEGTAPVQQAAEAVSRGMLETPVPIWVVGAAVAPFIAAIAALWRSRNAVSTKYGKIIRDMAVARDSERDKMQTRLDTLVREKDVLEEQWRHSLMEKRDLDRHKPAMTRAMSVLAALSNSPEIEKVLRAARGGSVVEQAKAIDSITREIDVSSLPPEVQAEIRRLNGT